MTRKALERRIAEVLFNLNSEFAESSSCSSSALSVGPPTARFTLRQRLLITPKKNIDGPTQMSRPRTRPTARALLARKACKRRLQPLTLTARHARQRLEPSLTLEVWPPPHADTPIRRHADTLLDLVLDFAQQQEHFWVARRVSEGSSLCLSWRATHGKGWSLRLRLSAFGLRPTPTTPIRRPADTLLQAYDPDAVNPSSARRAFLSFDTRLS